MDHARSLLVSIALISASGLLGSGLLSRPAAAAPRPARAQDESDEAVLERIGKLSENERKQLLELCVAAAEASEAPQVELIESWAALVDQDTTLLPERTEFEAHDARKYKGGPPRKLLRPGKKLWDELDARRFVSPADPRAKRARPALYEYSTGSLVQRESARALKERKLREKRKRRSRAEPGPEQPFRELLEGILPAQALAEEVLIRALDTRGAVRKEAHYFAHLYCDREANAYEFVTLFDMWSMPDELEIPDPDARAYAQLIWDDDTVPVPLTGRDHSFWYPRIETSYQNLRTYMFTTRALAAVWFEGRPALDDGYAESIDILNASIELCEGDPERLAEMLEASGAAFIGEAKAEIKSHGNDVWNLGNARRDEHAAGKLLIREAVLAVLAEQELL